MATYLLYSLLATQLLTTKACISAGTNYQLINPSTGYYSKDAQTLFNVPTSSQSTDSGYCLHLYTSENVLMLYSCSDSRSNLSVSMSGNNLRIQGRIVRCPIGYTSSQCASSGQVCNISMEYTNVTVDTQKARVYAGNQASPGGGNVDCGNGPTNYMSMFQETHSIMVVG
jgi:hypothetical protein